jgi:pimeloyl-ACP methyl ester carboxylesterase
MSAPALASGGYRVVVPFIRGYGTTRFLSENTVRNGEPAAIAVDRIAFMDALKIDKLCSVDLIGAPAPRISSPRCGPSAARPPSR